MRMPIKPSLLIAFALAAGAGAWIYSGQGDDGASSGDAMTEAPAAETAQTTGEERELPMVRVRDSVAQAHQAIMIFTGRTEADRSVTLRAETAGRVVEIGVEEGQRIDEDAEVARIAANDRYARLSEADALVRQREIEFEAASSLAGRGYQTESARAEAEANLEAARSARETIRVDVRRLTVSAPFAAIVESRPVEVGDYLSVGDEIATLVDLDPMIVAVQVSEREIAQVTVGGLAEIEAINGVRHNGIVSRIASTADPVTRTFAVEIEVENADGALLDGMTARVRLPSRTVSAHRISPAILTLNDSGEIGIRAVDDEDRVYFLPVQIVEDSADMMWIAGLPERVRMITVGQEFVREGVLVEPVNESQAMPEEQSPRDGLQIGDATGERS